MTAEISQVLQEGLSAFIGAASHHVVSGVDGTDGAASAANEEDEHLVFITGASSAKVLSRLRLNGFTKIREFCLLPSARRTRWIIPIGVKLSTSSGLDVYTPQKTVGRAWKQLLALFARMGWCGWARHRLVMGSRSPLNLELLVKEVTGEADPIFALSLGTPGRFRKLTVQIMNRDGEVLGYVKLPISHESVARIRNEAATLQYLSRFSALRGQVPRLLYEGQWGDGYILFQSPAGPARAAPREFGAAHRQFLQGLWDVESATKSGGTIVEDTGQRWKVGEQSLSTQWRELGEAALHAASVDLKSRSVRCGISHGDFAPWNTRLLGGRLFTFDWESARLSSPNQWDVFHFQAQAASLLNRNAHMRPHWDRPSGARGLRLLYLLNSVSDCFVERAPDAAKSLAYRFHALKEEISTSA